MADMEHAGGQPSEDEEYHRLALLEDLESLLEEIEEQGVIAAGQPGPVPTGIVERMNSVGVRDVQELRDRIMRLHADLDEDDRDLTITES